MKDTAKFAIMFLSRKHANGVVSMAKIITQNTLFDNTEIEKSGDLAL